MQLTTYNFAVKLFSFSAECLKRLAKHFFLFSQVGADKPWRHPMCCNSRTLSITLPARLSDCDIQGAALTYCAFCSFLQATKCLSQNVAHWVCTALHHHLLSPCLLLDAWVGVIVPSTSPSSTVKRNDYGMSTGIEVFEMLWAWYLGRFLCCSATCRASLNHFLSRQEVSMIRSYLGAKGSAMTA